MFTWMLAFVAVGMLGGLVLVHALAKAKHTSDRMLEEYRQLLVESRKAKPHAVVAKRGKQKNHTDDSPPPEITTPVADAGS